MNITLLISAPVFWVTIIVVGFFSSLSVLAIRNTKPRNLSNNEKIGITLIFAGEVIVIVFVIFFVWSISKESIVWAFQSHDNLLTTPGKVIESTTEWRGSPSRNAFGLHFQI